MDTENKEKFVPRSRRTSGASVEIEVPLRRGENGHLGAMLVFKLFYDPFCGALFSRGGLVEMSYNSPCGTEFDLNVFTSENVVAVLEYFRYVKKRDNTQNHRFIPRCFLYPFSFASEQSSTQERSHPALSV